MRYILIFFLLISTAYGQTTNFSFTAIPTGTEVVSPGRGVEHWNRLSPGPFSISNNQIEVPAGTTEVPDAYARFSWYEMETSEGVYNWTKFDQFVQTCIQKNKKASFGIMTVLAGEGISTGGALSHYPVYVHTAMQAAGSAADRDFIYNGSWVPNYNSEAYLSAFENLNNAIATHIANTSYNGVPYSRVIGYIDIRGIGEFGEWHHYPYIDVIYGSNRYPTIATFKRIVDAHKNAYPNYPLLSLISGYDPGASANTPAEITHYLLTQSNTWGKYGWRWDSWGQSIYSSILENNPGSYGGMDFDTSIANRYRFARVGGEPSSWEGGVSNGGTQSLYYLLPSQITLYGASFFGNGNYDAPTIAASSAATANIRNASRLAGYRIVLTGGSMTTTLASGGSFNVTLAYQNIGVAPVYENWDNIYQLRNSSNQVVWQDTSDFQLRHFLPSGSPTSSNENFTLGSVPAGTYRLHLIIKDSTQYRQPFPLAINGRQSDGSYILRSNITVTSTGNQPPVSNAGTDKNITLPTNEVALVGSGSDADGSITSYAWTKISGPSVFNIVSPNLSTTYINNLAAGTYVFRLTVTDNLGSTASDDVQVVVNATAPSNIPPVSNAGANQVIQLPTSSVTLVGSGTDADGTISTYAWTKISGTGGTIVSPSASSTSVTGLTQGTYVFRLTVTDNGGATAADDVQVTVTAANVSPTSNAGANQIITLPTNSASLTGSGTDSDGSISAYLWTKVSGPTGGTISSPSTQNTTISGLIQGTYVYRLRVTDNQSATATDDVTITVNPAPVVIPGNWIFNNNPATPETNIDGIGVVLGVKFRSTQAGAITQLRFWKIAGNSGTHKGAIYSSTGVKLWEGTFTGETASGWQYIDVDTLFIDANTTYIAAYTCPVGTYGSINGGLNVSTINNMLSAPSTSTSGGNGVYIYRDTMAFPTESYEGSNYLVDVNYQNIAAPVTPNVGPSVSAGLDATIRLPQTSYQIAATATDTDGTIAGLDWSQLSGPVTATISDTATLNPLLSDMTTPGVYQFLITVTDDDGATSSDIIVIAVNGASTNWQQRRTYNWKGRRIYFRR